MNCFKNSKHLCIDNLHCYAEVISLYFELSSISKLFHPYPEASLYLVCWDDYAIQMIDLNRFRVAFVPVVYQFKFQDVELFIT